MNGQKKGPIKMEKMLGLLERYKFVLLVVLIGAALLLWPQEKAPLRSEVGTMAAEPGGSFDLSEIERKMSAALSQIEGTGEVTVVLTVKNSSRQVLAEDTSTTAGDVSGEKTVETVVVSTGSGRQEPVLVEQIYPEFQGALVVCNGGGEVNVRLKLMEAVSALTGLGADKICICKGK